MLKIGSNGIDVLHVESCYAPTFTASGEGERQLLQHAEGSTLFHTILGEVIKGNELPE